jgi:hypothetical protein
MLVESLGGAVAIDSWIVDRVECKSGECLLHVCRCSMFLTMMYFLYLLLTRSILDIFNCSPTDPPDGKMYLQVCRGG